MEQKNGLQRKIESHWLQPKLMMSMVLWPLARIFHSLSFIRIKAHQYGLCKQEKLAVPVVIVGNIHVGGVGKTPLVLALVEELTAKGIKVGVISRGYGRRNKKTCLVQDHGLAADFGDEPLLIHSRTGVPVAVGVSRVEAAKCLLKSHAVDVILADDGMQHYHLHRDLEIAVFPAQDMRKKLDVLPNGPLRESLKRLKKIDALVVTGMNKPLASEVLAKQFDLQPSVFIAQSHLNIGLFYQLGQPENKVDASFFANKTCAAVAGIGQPQKFFRTLEQAGVRIASKKAFADHHDYLVNDMPTGVDAILVTEKDAVKLTRLALENVWVLPVSATISPNLSQFVIDKLHLC